MKVSKSRTSKSGAESSPISNPQRRATDHFHIGRIYPRENWYRDIWLLIITGIVVVTVRSSLETSKKAQRAIADVQQERVAAVRRNCAAQNERHDATIKELRLIYKSPPPPLKLNGVDLQTTTALDKLVAEQRISSLTPTLLLINALVPYQDCKKAVKLVLTQKITTR